MDLLDLFLNQRGESERIRRLSRQIARKSAKKKGARKAGRSQDDLGTLALVVLTTIKLLEEKGVMSQEEFQSRLAGLDQLDGARDGKIDAETLRRALGLGTGPALATARLKKVRRITRKRRVREARKVREQPAERPKPSPPARPASKTASFGGPAKSPSAPVPEMPALPDLGTEGQMDPQELGEISYEDYFGEGKKD
ncbi:MAG: hypothetical protein ACYTGB_14910 [Planctomycetota bacterium]|jgi:hypothetical protein